MEGSILPDAPRARHGSSLPRPPPSARARAPTHPRREAIKSPIKCTEACPFITPPVAAPRRAGGRPLSAALSQKSVEPSLHYATFKFLVGRCQCQRSSPRTVGSHFPFQCGPMQLGWVIMDRPDRPLAHIGAQTRVWGWGRTEERSSRPRSRGGRTGLYMGNQF